jgi:hypothetical protein
MSVGLVSHDGDLRRHRHRKAAPAPCRQAVAPAREGLVVAVEGVFTGYGLAALGAHAGLPFVLGHALSMNAIHGGHAQHAPIDAHQMAARRRGGRLPQASVDPAQRRATRARLRRRTHLRRTRSALWSHVQQTNRQDHRPEIGTKMASKANRAGVAERCSDPAGHKTIAVDLARSTSADARLNDLERSLLTTAKHPDANPLSR